MGYNKFCTSAYHLYIKSVTYPYVTLRVWSLNIKDYFKITTKSVLSTTITSHLLVLGGMKLHPCLQQRSTKCSQWTSEVSKFLNFNDINMLRAWRIWRSVKRMQINETKDNIRNTTTVGNTHTFSSTCDFVRALVRSFAAKEPSTFRRFIPGFSCRLTSI